MSLKISEISFNKTNEKLDQQDKLFNSLLLEKNLYELVYVNNYLISNYLL